MTYLCKQMLEKNPVFFYATQRVSQFIRATEQALLSTCFPGCIINHYKDPINGKYPAGFLLPLSLGFHPLNFFQDRNIWDEKSVETHPKLPLEVHGRSHTVGEAPKNNKKEKLRKRLGGG